MHTTAAKEGLEVVDPITDALAAGAAAGLGGVASRAVQDAYAALRASLAARLPGLEPHVGALEARPDSQERQSFVAEGVIRAGLQGDTELLRLAGQLLEAVGRAAPPGTGVDLERLRAGGSVDIADAQGKDVGVHGRDWDVTGDVLIRRAHGGPDPNR